MSMRPLDLLFYAAMIFLVGITAGVFWRSLHAQCLRAEEIVSIGGCDRYGNCGYATKNTSGVRSYPTLGEMICIESK